MTELTADLISIANRGLRVRAKNSFDQSKRLTLLGQLRPLVLSFAEFHRESRSAEFESLDQSKRLMLLGQPRPSVPSLSQRLRSDLALDDWLCGRQLATNSRVAWCFFSGNPFELWERIRTGADVLLIRVAGSNS